MADESLDDAWANALDEKTGGGGGGDDDWSSIVGGAGDAGNVRAAAFTDLGEGATVSAESQNLDFLLDIPLEITVELGRTRMIINNLLQLTQGSVVELDKAAAEMVEIYVNSKLLGKGEVIVVNDRFGVRITEIISQADRIKNIG